MSLNHPMIILKKEGKGDLPGQKRKKRGKNGYQLPLLGERKEVLRLLFFESQGLNQPVHSEKGGGPVIVNREGGGGKGKACITRWGGGGKKGEQVLSVTHLTEPKERAFLAVYGVKGKRKKLSPPAMGGRGQKKEDLGTATCQQKGRGCLRWLGERKKEARCLEVWGKKKRGSRGRGAGGEKGKGAKGERGVIGAFTEFAEGSSKNNPTKKKKKKKHCATKEKKKTVSLQKKYRL